MAQSGFILYADDWAQWTEDYTNEETGALLKALINYFFTGEIAEFDDRGMKQFFRQAIKSIDRDRERYEEKCLRNMHNRYKGTCKKNGSEPLDFEEWLTTVDRRQESLTVVDESAPTTTTAPTTTATTTTAPTTTGFLRENRQSENANNPFLQNLINKGLV